MSQKTCSILASLLSRARFYETTLLDNKMHLFFFCRFYTLTSPVVYCPAEACWYLLSTGKCAKIGMRQRIFARQKKGLLLCVFIFLSNFGLMGSPHVPTDLTSSVSKGNKGAGVTRNHFQLYSPTRKHSVDYKLGSIKVNTKGR